MGRSHAINLRQTRISRPSPSLVWVPIPHSPCRGALPLYSGGNNINTKWWLKTFNNHFVSTLYCFIFFTSRVQRQGFSTRGMGYRDPYLTRGNSRNSVWPGRMSWDLPINAVRGPSMGRIHKFHRGQRIGEGNQNERARIGRTQRLRVMIREYLNYEGPRTNCSFVKGWHLGQLFVKRIGDR